MAQTKDYSIFTSTEQAAKDAGQEAVAFGCTAGKPVQQADGQWKLVITCPLFDAAQK